MLSSVLWNDCRACLPYQRRHSGRLPHSHEQFCGNDLSVPLLCPKPERRELYVGELLAGSIHLPCNTNHSAYQRTLQQKHCGWICRKHLNTNELVMSYLVDVLINFLKSSWFIPRKLSFITDKGNLPPGFEPLRPEKGIILPKRLKWKPKFDFATSVFSSSVLLPKNILTWRN